MFQKILVAIDNSEMSQQVFEKSVSLAQATGGSLMLLHVLSNLDEQYLALSMQPYILYPEAQANSKKSQSDWEELKELRLDWLRSLCKQATDAGVKAEFSLNIGDPCRRICNVAESIDADTIVIGRRGHRGWSEFFLGSISNYVLHHASVSVLTIQGLMSTQKASESEEPVTSII